jgi:hypothetical protein
MAAIYFVDRKTERNFNRLKANEELKDLYRFILRAIEDIKHKPDCGTAIPKKLIPRRYIKKYDIDNLYKYDLPNAWRLLYSLGKEGIEIVAIILEWCSHKEYERIFGYRAR